MQTDSVAVAPELLSAKLLARALHDVSGAASGLTSALDLLSEMTDDAVNEDALVLARDSVSQLGARIAFYRAAFGTDEALTGQTTRGLMEGLFGGSRARLHISHMPDTGPSVILQGMLIFAQISAVGLATGGVAEASVKREAAGWRGRIEAKGVKANLYPEARIGLNGQALISGLSGRWAPARYLRALIDTAGGALDFGTEEGGFWLEISAPDAVTPRAG